MKGFFIFLSCLLLGANGGLSSRSSFPVWNALPSLHSMQNPNRPAIALTFDDGPHPHATDALLTLLNQERVPATFFVVGKMAERYPDVIRDMHRSGHEVANHTYSHPRMSRLTAEQIREELTRTNQAIARITGQPARLYRPPGGAYSRRSARAAHDAGYHMALWSIQTKDITGASSALIEQRILEQAADGGIVLMHSGIPATLQALPAVIQSLRQKGYRFVTVSHLLGFASDDPLAFSEL